VRLLLELDSDELMIIPYNVEEIHFTDPVKEVIFLSIPMKPLCKDSCKGLCVHCGTDLNYETCNCKEESVDPRWEKLREFKKA